jgi:hypothetical protein
MHEPIKFQVSMVMKIMMNILFGRGVAALNSLDSYQCYGGACCLHIQCSCEQVEQWGELHFESTGTSYGSHLCWSSRQKQISAKKIYEHNTCTGFRACSEHCDDQNNNDQTCAACIKNVGNEKGI